MLVITQDTYKTLTEEVKFCKKSAVSWKCIALRFSIVKNKPDHWFNTAMEKTNLFLGSEGAVYLFPDNDLYIFCRHATHKTLDVLYNACLPLWNGQDKAIVSRIYELPFDADMVLDEIAIKEQALSSKKDQDVPETINHYNPINDPSMLPFIQTLHAKRMQRHTIEILVSEDDPFSSRILCKVLDEKHVSRPAYDGAKTVESYIFHAPDILFLDIGLPDVNGLDLLADILSIDPHAYIVMISGSGSKENVLKAINMGAKGFIAQPFTKDKIYQHIDKYLQHSNKNMRHTNY